MSIHNLAGVEAAAEMGITRAVLSRELSLEQIRFISQHASIETEVFVHGALCFCYSGQCYMSALIGRRSGNRGACAQPCRMQYSMGGRMDEYPLIEEFRLQKVRKSLGIQLSGGERRRTEIARAVAINPAFILLDEPFAGVDPIAVEDIQSIVATLKHKNIGVIITDHNVDETLAITDRTYLLYEGKILKTGTAEELAADPMVRKVYLGQHFELKKSHQLTQEMKNRKGQEVNE